jgi:ribosomal protein S12 methylthiotransferase
MEQIRFERLGAFIFSPEENTPAVDLPHKVGKLVAERRYHILMETQAEISYEFNRSRIGKEYKVLIDDYDEQRKRWIGRSYAEAPEVDGIIWVQSEKHLEVGNFYQVKIKEAETYDLYGEIINAPNTTNLEGNKVDTHEVKKW